MIKFTTAALLLSLTIIIALSQAEPSPSTAAAAGGGDEEPPIAMSLLARQQQRDLSLLNAGKQCVNPETINTAECGRCDLTFDANACTGSYNDVTGHQLITCPDLCGEGLALMMACDMRCNYGANNFHYCAIDLLLSVGGCTEPLSEAAASSTIQGQPDLALWCVPAGCEGKIQPQPSSTGGGSGSGEGNESQPNGTGGDEGDESQPNGAGGDENQLSAGDDFGSSYLPVASSCGLLGILFFVDARSYGAGISLQ